jgi:hypothetical protein
MSEATSGICLFSFCHDADAGNVCDPHCFARKRNPDEAPASKQPDGQITKSLSIPSRKNIPLNPTGKSVLPTRPVSPDKRGVAHVTKRAG